MLRLRRDDQIGKAEAAEVIIVNSHDGTNAHQMFAGMLRFVCTNSLIAGERFEEVRVRPKGKIQDQIIEGVFTVAEDFPRLIDASEQMKDTRLSEPEQRVLAEASLVVRYGEDDIPVRPEQIRPPPPRGCRTKPVDHVQRHSGERAARWTVRTPPECQRPDTL